MATKEPAQSAKEFYDKYSRKRYTPENAGLCTILNYIYLTLLQREDEDSREEFQLPETLYTPERQNAIILKAIASENNSNVSFLSSMLSLVGWLATAHDSALIERNSVNVYLNTALHDIGGLDPTARIILEAGNREKPDVLQFIIDRGKSYTREYRDMRDFIINSFCFVLAYNTLIDMIGKDLSVPEFYVFKIATMESRNRLSKLNRFLLDYAHIDKPEYLTVDTTPIEIPPIPDDNIKAADYYIKAAIKNREAWSVSLTQMTDNYWRRDIGDNG